MTGLHDILKDCVKYTSMFVTYKYTILLREVSLDLLILFRAPASSALTLVPHQSYNVHTANHHLCSSGKRNGEQRRTKVSFCRTMMQALELLRLVKKHVSRQNKF